MSTRLLIKPWRFRFTEPDDVRQFGDGWFVYDEAQIVKLPLRQLAALETELGMTLVSAIDGFRTDTVMGRAACTWLAIRAQDPDLAGPFADYSPAVLLARFEQVEDEAAAPLDGTPTSESSPTSAPPDSDLSSTS